MNTKTYTIAFTEYELQVLNVILLGEAARKMLVDSLPASGIEVSTVQSVRYKISSELEKHD